MTTSRIYAYRWPARLVSHKPFAAESYSITPSCIWQVFFRKKNEFSFLFSPFCQRAHFLCKMHNPQAFLPVENSAAPAVQCLVWAVLPLLYIYNKRQGRSTTGLALSVKACRLCQIPPFCRLRAIFPRRGGSLSSKGEPLAVHANFISLPRPLPLGEVDANVVSRRRGRGCFPAARPFPKKTSVGKLPLPSTTPSREKANRQSPQALPVCKH